MYFIFHLWHMLSNRTLNNGPVHYTKDDAPFTVITHIFFEFLQSWLKD